MSFDRNKTNNKIDNNMSYSYLAACSAKKPGYGAGFFPGFNRPSLRREQSKTFVVVTPVYFIHDPVASMATSHKENLVMATEDRVTVKGASGRAYEFMVYPWGQKFNPVGGEYLVLKRQIGNYGILYIGQTGDLSERFDDHHKQGCFDRNAKTHIGVRVENSEAGRLAIESDLLGNYKTVCNF
jgi:hypothetical protein